MPTTRRRRRGNGKFYHAGGGGFVGSIPRSTAPLARGNAVIGTDTGHVGGGAFGAASMARGRSNKLESQIQLRSPRGAQ